MSGKLRIEEAINRLEEVRSICLGMTLSEMTEKDDQNVFGLVSDVLGDNIPILEDGFRELLDQIHAFRLKEHDQGKGEMPEQVKAFLKEKVAKGVEEKLEDTGQRLSRIATIDCMNQIEIALRGVTKLMKFACDAIEQRGEYAGWMLPIIESLDQSTESMSVVKNELNTAWQE